MRLRSLRLRNIKSYGEGVSGTGVTIPFQPGINRIAGRNGHGKSTLIEALGYALFLADPPFEEKFQVHTYLLRSDAKHGEIEVSFEMGGQGFRVIRGVGSKSPLRDKVLVDADGSIAAEGKAEVDAFLCRLFELPDPARLRELFGKLLGVKQGRLTWPFDMKPAEARRHFEPLLDVDIFRQCFDRLKPVSDRFEALATEQRIQLEGVRQRISDRSDSTERAARAEVAVTHLESERSVALQALAAAQASLLRHESAEAALRVAERDAQNAAQKRLLTQQSRDAARAASEEAAKAGRTVEETRPAFDAHVAAAAALRTLLLRQADKEALEKAVQAESRELALLAAQRLSARDQSAVVAAQRATRETNLRDYEEELLRLETSLRDSTATHESKRGQTEAAVQAAENFRAWLDRLRHTVRRHQPQLARWREDALQVQSWDPGTPDRVRDHWQRASARHAELERALAAAREGRARLTRQLEEIAGGVCPFLKERCRQFDPAKVEQDLSVQNTAIDQLSASVAEALISAQSAQHALDKTVAVAARMEQLRKGLDSRAAEITSEYEHFVVTDLSQWVRAMTEVTGEKPADPGLPRVPCASPSDATSEAGDPGRWLPPLDAAALGAAQLEGLAELERFDSATAPKIAEAVDRFRRADVVRNQQVQDAVHRGRQREALRQELVELGQQHQMLTRSLATLESTIQPIEARLATLHEQLTTFSDVAPAIVLQQETLHRNADAHQRHLEARGIADQAPQRAEALRAVEAALAALAQEADARHAALDQARAGFDAAALATVRAQVLEGTAVVRGAEARLEAARTDLAREQQRRRELDEARAREALVLQELGRLAANRDITDRARKLLRDAAPGVAQRLCDRIAARAQQLLAHIHHEATQLSWSAESYSLRIDPGDRRFAMLSGGEQTKVALALTLSMIQEFSPLKFCVFDEPTYGVDAESRRLLAGTIVEVQKASAFDQLLLVSHDDAFEGVIEYVIQLEKSAVSGTTLEPA